MESSEARKNFIESAAKTLVEYGFDGIDLAWQFPAEKPIKSHGTLGIIFFYNIDKFYSFILNKVYYQID